MTRKPKKFILAQMFDVRPTKKDGHLNFEKINKVQKVLKIKAKRIFPKTKKPIGDVFYDIDPKKDPRDLVAKWNSDYFEKKKKPKKQKISVSGEDLENISWISIEHKNLREEIRDEFPAESHPEYFKTEDILSEEEKIKKEFFDFSSPDLFLPKKYNWRNFSIQKVFLSFAATGAVIFILIASVSFIGYGLGIKNSALSSSQEAYASLLAGKDQMAAKNFQKASFEFGEAYDRFSEIANDLDSLGKITLEASKYIPFASKLSSGSHLAQAGKDVSRIGILLGGTLEALDKIRPLGAEVANTQNGDQPVSYLKIFQDSDKNIKEVSSLLQDLEKNLDEVNVDDLPEADRDKFIALKNKLPFFNQYLGDYSDNSRIFTDILGGNGPRKYLFLFQNNQEMRATGGFIGTYGLLDIFNGQVRKFYIDGIFNPDGQLREKVIPPAPIQKISAAWSLHDSNWFPDFPVSAEKAAWFFEKTGGPTVDGVVTMTPTVMQKLLEVTGPIDMPEYGVTVDKDNFIEKVQYAVETDYDKELNQPKKILADLAPLILDKIFNADNFSQAAKTMQILSDSLSERHILIYSKNYEIEKALSRRGWTGEILDTQKDYLSVINTNINGFKTDGVISENITHQAEIQPDGTIVDSLTITRHHNGGDTAYDFWNKVNADYMRVYVPKGAKLLSVSGQTREFNSPPLDYGALGFKKDPQVAMEEESAQIDEQSGTRIYEDAGKTVFANWVYVSPQETVEVNYKYVLPFKIDTNLTSKPADTYSLLVQKQAGSIGSKFSEKIIYPDFYKIIWKYPEADVSEINDLSDGKKGISMENDLQADKFIGVAFGKK